MPLTGYNIVGRIFSFGAIQIAQMLLPLLALPYLARVLGPEPFGLLMWLNVVSLVTSFFLDWGFLQGEVRHVAQNRQKPRKMALIWSHGLLAKILLVFPVALGLWLYYVFLPHPPFTLAALFWAFMAGVARSFSPFWFFQGQDDGSIHRLAMWDTASSALLLGLTFVFIRQPEDAICYLVLFALCKGGAYFFLCLLTGRRYFIQPRLRDAVKVLGSGRVFFAGGIAGQAYSNWTHLALGSIVTAQDMGFFLTSDKIVRAVVSLSNPITQALFPEICAMHGRNDVRLRLHLQRMTFGAALLTGVCAGSLIWVLAPQVMSLVLGDAPAEAVQAARVMAFVIPLLAANMVMGPQILVPMGKERLVILAQTVAALVSIPLTLLLASLQGLKGALALPLLAEGCIFIILLRFVWQHCPNLFLPTRSYKDR